MKWAHGKELQIEKLHRYLELMTKMLCRDMTTPDKLEVLEPATERFDAPPDTGNWNPFKINSRWGGKNCWVYFRTTIRIPEKWIEGAIDLRMSHQPVYLENLQMGGCEAAGPEGQVFINGERWGAIDREHHVIRYPFKRNETYDIRAVFYAGRVSCRHILKEFGLAWVDTSTEKLYHDLRIAVDTLEQIEKESPVYRQIMDAVNSAFGALDMRDVSEVDQPKTQQEVGFGECFYTSIPEAQKIFDQTMALLPSVNTSQVSCVGHAHIDLAWLWPIRQSHHKCVRTFSTQCRLLDQFDSWVFNQSSPQAYAWIEQDAPELFQKIREHITNGRWEAEGAMWCESDTNIPCGESLVRQLLYGKHFFKEKFGIDSRLLWLPDVFGYSGALPQLLKLAGVDSFVTSKISWNQVNRFPYETFRWRGIDGTEVATHFITSPEAGSPYFTYNGGMTASEVKGTQEAYSQRSLGHTPLLTFGFGDGGGGPTEHMLETSRRLAATPGLPGMPGVKLEKAGTMMKRIVEDARNLPIWDGELYLEYHRGTYTTQAWLKRANRKNEIRLHSLEWLASLSYPHGYRLDKEKLHALWQLLLLAQFHDILPGTSVSEVYTDEVRPMLEQVARDSEQMINDILVGNLCDKIDTSGYKQPIILFNTLSWDRSDPIQLTDGSWLDGITVPAGGWTAIDLAGNAKRKENLLTVKANGRELDNKYWKLRLDDQGHMSELVDKISKRSVLPQGIIANQWQIFEDRPLNFDAWDIDAYYEDHPLPAPEHVTTKVVEQSEVRIAVEVIWRIPKRGSKPESVITQRIALYAQNPRIDFETSIEWHEHHQLLKVAFPTVVRATEATYQIQFGHVRRPTHQNTSWDQARFESCAHQFVDLSEYGYGVALLNDCKYGYDVHKNVIRLTCIKSPQHPDPLADQGHHEFTYSLLPHAGSFQKAGIIRAAAELNVPVMVQKVSNPSSGVLPSHTPFITCTSEAVIIETIKPAEDGDGIVLRMRESFGSHVDASLIFSSKPKRVEEVNILEEPFNDDIHLTYSDNQAFLSLRPFQIVTLRVKILQS